MSEAHNGFVVQSSVIVAFAAALDHGRQAVHEMNIAEWSVDTAVEHLARQYQYLSLTHAYERINNALFMDLFNAQLGLIGLEPIVHGYLDFAAQSLRPDTSIAIVKEIILSGKNVWEDIDLIHSETKRAGGICVVKYVLRKGLDLRHINQIHETITIIF